MARTRVSQTVTVGDVKFKPQPGRTRSTSDGVERYWQARRYIGLIDGKPVREQVWRGWARTDQLPAIASELEPRTERGHEEEEPPPFVVAGVTRDELRGGDVALLIRAWRGARNADPDYSEYTRKNDRTVGRRLTEIVGGVRLKDVNNRTGAHLRKQLRARFAVSTTRASLAGFVAIWRWALRNEIVDHALDFSDEYRRLRDAGKRGEDTGERAKPTPSEEDAWAISDALAAGAPPWTSTAFALLMMTGARIGEIATLRWADLGDQVVRATGKTGPREVFVDARALATIHATRPTSATDEERVLPVSIETARKHLGGYMARACEAAGVLVLTPHALRRFAVQQYIRRGVAPSVAAEQLGHTPEVMLKHYAQAQDVDKRDAARKVGLGMRPPRGDDNVPPLHPASARQSDS